MPKTTVAKKKPKSFKSWSFSRYIEHRTCPLAAKLKHLDKVPIADQPRSPALEHGSTVALKTEHYLAKAIAKMPLEIKPLEADYKAIRATKGLIIEKSYGFTRDWVPCSPEDWDRCWLRVKQDMKWPYKAAKGRGSFVGDNKTGKHRPEKAEEYLLQLDLYATTEFALDTAITEVKVQLFYSDLGIKYPDEPAVYTRDQFESMVKKWEARVKPMFNDTRFPARPGPQCRWCPYQRNRSGHCRF